MKSDDISQLAKALSKVQSELTPVPRNSENPFFHSRYAELSACIKHAAPLLGQNGLAIVQTGEPTERGVTLQTTLIHESGQWISGQMTVTPTKNDPQGYGSSLTYLRRYGFMSIIGLAQEGEDDDSDQASVPQPQSEREKEAPGAFATAKKAMKYDEEFLANRQLQEEAQRKHKSTW